MSPGFWHRLDELFHRGMHHHDVLIRREIAIMGYNHLKACVDSGNAKIASLTSENADLKSQLAAAQSKPAGTTDDQLETLAGSIEAALGEQIADPDLGSHTAIDPATGLPVSG